MKIQAEFVSVLMLSNLSIMGLAALSALRITHFGTESSVWHVPLILILSKLLVHVTLVPRASNTIKPQKAVKSAKDDLEMNNYKDSVQ